MTANATVKNYGNPPTVNPYNSGEYMKDRSVYSNAKVSEILRQDMIVSEEPKHVRKSSSSTSRSDKRSDHKHEYEKVIVRFIRGFEWSERCRICRKFAPWKTSACISRRDFVRPEFLSRRGFRFKANEYLSLDDIRRKFPDVLIFEEKIDKEKHKLYIVEVTP